MARATSTMPSSSTVRIMSRLNTPPVWRRPMFRTRCLRSIILSRPACITEASRNTPKWSFMVVVMPRRMAYGSSAPALPAREARSSTWARAAITAASPAAALPFFAARPPRYSAAAAPARRPNTTVSRSELPPSRFPRGNRLGGNSLLETVVFGRRAGAAAAEYLGGLAAKKGSAAAGEAAVIAARAQVDDLASRAGSAGAEDPYAIRLGMTTTMKDHFGVFREASVMQAGLDKMIDLKQRVRNIGLRHTGGVFNLDMIRTVELEGMVDVALAIAAGALARTESRGSHSRTDFPDRDDANWLRHTLAFNTPDGPSLESKPVALGMFEPQERKY